MEGGDKDTIPDSQPLLMHVRGLCMLVTRKYTTITILKEITNKNHLFLYSKLIHVLSCALIGL